VVPVGGPIASLFDNAKELANPPTAGSSGHPQLRLVFVVRRA
jgi:hypothetical protein